MKRFKLIALVALLALSAPAQAKVHREINRLPVFAVSLHFVIVVIIKLPICYDRSMGRWRWIECDGRLD